MGRGLLLSVILILIQRNFITSSTIETCPENFIRLNNLCILPQSEFTRVGKFEDAREFCDRFNPTGYKGLLLTVGGGSMDQTTQALLSSLIDGYENEGTNFPIWNGFVPQINNETENAQFDVCFVLDYKENDLVVKPSRCDKDYPFICAVRKLDQKCVDFIHSDFCADNSLYFCNTTGQLGTLCPKTCGLCDVVHSCASNFDIWSEDFCRDMSSQGYCTSSVDNIATFCPKTCCHLTHDSVTQIGDQELAQALSNDCDNTRDLSKCPRNPDVEQCFHDREFTIACMHTCCLYSKSIRDVALSLEDEAEVADDGEEDFGPQKRYSDFDDKLNQHYCRSRFDDIFPHSVCQAKSDPCSPKFEEYCETTCCLLEGGFAGQSSTLEPRSGTTSTTTPAIADECEHLENIYSEVVCSIAQTADDCSDPQFRKHCKYRCCDLGYGYATGTTLNPDELCNEEYDSKRRCANVESLEDCDLDRYADCEYSCCMLKMAETETESTTTTPEQRVQTSTEAAKTTTEIPDDCDTDPCCNEVDAKILRCAKVETVEDCDLEKFQVCDYTCCQLRYNASMQTTTTTTGAVETTPDQRVGTTSTTTETVIETTEEPDECDSYEDFLSKCYKVTESTAAEYCVEEPFTSGCPYSCCMQGELPEERLDDDDDSSEELNCYTKEDKMSKCPKLATRKNCHDEPYKSKCEFTCCDKFGVADVDERVPEEDECAAEEDIANKCNNLSKRNKKKCFDKPFRFECRKTCCELGISMDLLASSTTGTTSQPTTPEGGNRCTGKRDRATKCKKLKTYADPAYECECSEELREDCPLSCCLYKHGLAEETTTTEEPVETTTPDQRVGSTTATATPEDCTSYDDFSPNCVEMNLTMSVCEQPTFDMMCQYTCCVVNGGVTAATTTTENVTTTTPGERVGSTSTTTLAPTTTTEDPSCQNNGDEELFEECEDYKDEYPMEYCTAVVQSHVDGTERDLCQNVEARNQCLFSCCVFYWSTDTPSPRLPDPLEPEDCENLEDDPEYTYEECFNNYLNGMCDIHCQLTCCLLDDAEVPVNPGCYDKDDQAMNNNFCLSNCQSEDHCKNKQKCQEKCDFHCCVIRSDPGSEMTTEGTTPETTVKPTTTVSYSCMDTEDDKGNAYCLDAINFDASRCEPSMTMYDVNGCNNHCCNLEIDLVTPTTTEQISTTNDTDIEVVV